MGQTGFYCQRNEVMHAVVPLLMFSVAVSKQTETD